MLVRPASLEQLVARGIGEVDAAPSVPVPAGLDPALATLAVPLAAAMARADGLADSVADRVDASGELVLDGYGLHSALLHAEILRRGEASGRPVPRALVRESRELRVSAARAWGADVEDQVAQPPVEGCARDDGIDPALAQRAIGVLAEQGWRFQPLITGALTIEELRSADPAALADHVALVIAA